MEDLKIEYINLDEIKPYEGNAKKHPKKQIEEIAASIKQFGMNDPIGIAGDTIIEGHGRYLALQLLGQTDHVPVIRLDHLSEEERAAYVHVHNKLTMDTGFDMKALTKDLEKITSIDMKSYGIDLSDPKYNLDLMHQTYKDNTRYSVLNILNLAKGQFPGEGKYDIPILDPVTELRPIDEWIGFNYVLSDNAPERKAVHFFVDDYQFERLWNNPEKYLEKLKRYAAVATPDFSPYGDMPNVLQIYNHYRKHWVGKWLQENGVTVIPTIRKSTDPRSDEWYLDGEPHNGIVLISSMWTGNDEIKDIFNLEYHRMRERLRPSKVLIYGKPLEDFDYGKHVEFIKSFTEKRWEWKDDQG